MPTTDAVPEFHPTLPKLDNKPVALGFQQALMTKLLEETWQFPNVIYSLGNEYTGPGEWENHWADRIHHFGKSREVKLLVSQMNFTPASRYIGPRSARFDVWDMGAKPHQAGTSDKSALARHTSTSFERWYGLMKTGISKPTYNSAHQHYVGGYEGDLIEFRIQKESHSRSS